MILHFSLATYFISNCTEISKPGDYVLTKDLHFAKTPETYQNPGDVCLRITSSNVTLNCNGHSITGSNENNTYGIHTYDLYNFSMKNCIVSSFGSGVHLSNSHSIFLTHNSFFSSIFMGDGLLKPTSNIFISNNEFTRSTLSGGNYSNLTVIDNTFNEIGVGLALGSNSIFSNNHFNSDSPVYFGFYSYEPGAIISNNSFSYSISGIHGEGLIFANNTIPSSTYNGLDISRLKNSQLINNTICSSNLNRSTSYNNRYFDLYNSGIATNITYINNTCDTSNPKHLCTKSCKGSDVLSKSNCPFSFILIGFIFLAFLRGKNQ